MTQETELPAPLVPAEVDLRGYEFMPLYGDRLFKSETWIGANAEGKVACLRLWWHAYAHEVPAASLPDNDALLADYAGYGVAVRAWKKVRAHAMRGFVLCSDGRWYHRFLAELAIEAWEMRKNHGETAEARQTRQQRWREQCKALSQQLRDKGITPPRGASLETLKRLLGIPANTSRPSTQTSTVDAAEIGKTGQDRTGQKSSTARAGPVVDNSGTEAGRWAVALLSRGVKITPAHPTLLQWIADGFTLEQVIEALAIARQRKPEPEQIAANYLDPILRDPPRKAEDAWWLDDNKTMAKAQELGVSTYGKGKAQLQQEIKDAIAVRKRAA